ncbi:MAG: hypothetical protein D6732_13280 [Methanobacteriota archaeon]|nr:MAG: hypothetical protein D6732_13280 [Euryarchaeota archaeon]
MSVGNKLEEILKTFEEKTEGILGSSVIDTNQALVMAEASQSFDRGIIQGTSAKIIDLAVQTLRALLGDQFKLISTTIQEENHYIYVRQINDRYHLVVITDTSETPGLREMNIKQLSKQLANVLNGY